MNDTDRRLIADSLNGQTAAYGTLVQRHQDRLYNAMVRILDHPEDAADVVQEAFINAYTSLANFKGDAEFFTWLYRIAFNSAISLRRKRRQTLSLNQTIDGEKYHDPADTSTDHAPDAGLLRSEDERRVQFVLRSLSEEHRAVLVLKDMDGLKYEQIAETLGVPIGTIRSRIHRARGEFEELYRTLEDSLQDPDPRTKRRTHAG